MAIGPVQLIVLGFDHPNFHGEIIAELERLRESDTVRVIDALAVHKDADGEIEVQHLSNLSKDEAIELGSKVGALIGLGIEQFSITPAAIGPIKAMVLSLDAGRIRTRVEQLLDKPPANMRKALSDWARRHKVATG